MAQAVLWALVGISCLGLVVLGGVVYELLRQQGRLLLRLEQLEGFAAGVPAHAPAGLEVGTSVPDFSLRDLDSQLRSLEDFRGQRVLLVHWSPACGFCTRIASELADFEGKLRARKTELVLVSAGDAEANRAVAQEHGLTAPVLLQDEQIAAFSGLGTPAAYLIDEEGRVAAPLALGADEVPELARAAASGRKILASERTLNDSRIEREGLKPGTPAPEFELEDVRGGTIALSDLRDGPLLLVFSDPDCGPCNALLPELGRLREGTNVVMVSRGDPQVNRVKAEEHGLDFPVAVQKGWTLSKAYGIFATPVAFLIEDGVISRPVARGKDEILALAGHAGRGAPLAH